MNVTHETLIAVAGVVVSILFSYIPGLRTWFAAQTTEFKRLVMLGVVALVTVSIYLLGCYAIIPTDIACEQAGIVQLIGYFITAITANQATFSLTPVLDDVKRTKEAKG